MSETENFPPAWRTLVGAQATSQRDLAEKAGLSAGTVNRMVKGVGRPAVESVRKVAAIISNGDTDRIWQAIGSGHRDYGDFDLSEVADELALLTPGQRKALVVLVRSIADPHGKRADGSSNAGPRGGPSDDSGPQANVIDFPEQSEVDDSMLEAALETTEGLDESPGGSDPDVE